MRYKKSRAIALILVVVFTLSLMSMPAAAYDDLISYFAIMNPGTGTYNGYTNSSGDYTITYNSKSWDLDKWGYYYYYD